MPSKNKRLFGLIGNPLGHSFSKKYFTEKFEKEGLKDCQFELFPLPSIEDLPALLEKHPNLEGLSVTIPYKQQVLPFLDEMDERANEIGAVNCIRIRDGKLTGFNTDSVGFEQTLKTFIHYDKVKAAGSRMPNAIVLGTGGASKAVSYVLRKLEIPYTPVSRKRKLGVLVYKDLTHLVMGTLGLIVNTTPLGTFPDVDNCPEIPYEYLDRRHYVFDLVYNPDPTTFLKKAAAQGCLTKNGLEMLHIQAEKAWTIWNE